MGINTLKDICHHQIVGTGPSTFFSIFFLDLGMKYYFLLSFSLDRFSFYFGFDSFLFHVFGFSLKMFFFSQFFDIFRYSFSFFTSVSNLNKIKNRKDCDFKTSSISISFSKFYFFLNFFLLILL